MSALPIEDMRKTYIGHSMVIDNFVMKGSAREEFSAAPCADENFFPFMGAVVQRRNFK